MPVSQQDEEEILNVNEWEDISIDVTLDNGACRSVMPRQDALGDPARDSYGSRRGQNVVVGDGGSIPNEGQVSLNLEADIGGGATERLASTFQAADLTRLLARVSHICEQGCECIFAGTHATIGNREVRTMGRVEKRGQLYVAQMKLKSPDICWQAKLVQMQPASALPVSRHDSPAPAGGDRPDRRQLSPWRYIPRAWRRRQGRADP